MVPDFKFQMSLNPPVNLFTIALILAGLLAINKPGSLLGIQNSNSILGPVSTVQASGPSIPFCSRCLAQGHCGPVVPIAFVAGLVFVMGIPLTTAVYRFDYRAPPWSNIPVMPCH